MGCNTSQEQKSAVAEENGDVNVNGESTDSAKNNKSAANSAKNGKKSAHSETLTNGHIENGTVANDEGNFFPKKLYVHSNIYKIIQDKYEIYV